MMSLLWIICEHLRSSSTITTDSLLSFTARHPRLYSPLPGRDATARRGNQGLLMLVLVSAPILDLLRRDAKDHGSAATPETHPRRLWLETKSEARSFSDFVKYSAATHVETRGLKTFKHIKEIFFLKQWLISPQWSTRPHTLSASRKTPSDLMI